MTSEPLKLETVNLRDPLAMLAESLAARREAPDQLAGASRQLADLARSAREASQDDLARAASFLSQLLEVARATAEEHPAAEEGEAGRMRDFVQAQLPVLQRALAAEISEEVDTMIGSADQRWRDWVSLLDDAGPLDGHCATPSTSPRDSARCGNSNGAGPADSVEQKEPSEQEIQLLLSAIQAATPPAADGPGRRESSSGEDRFRLTAARFDATLPEPTSPATSVEPASPGSAMDSPEWDRELLAAFLEDAGRCLSAIEDAALAWESAPQSKEAVRRICRELHTLKGASASVGLSETAALLHELEDLVQREPTGQEPPADAETLLKRLDVVRRRIEAATRHGFGSAGSESLGSAVAAATHLPRMLPGETYEDGPQGEGTVRVKASRLGRLLDMLAQLVMLRNRRDSRVARLKSVHSELTGCVSRLRLFHDAAMGGVPTQREPSSRGLNPMSELACDILESARGLRELYEPVAEENLAVSCFIQQFQQELMQLSRLPIAGLFRRLQRAVRDAARAEGKHVRLEFVGTEVGLDCALQERLYEPLLHLVRNAVSHGMETEAQRLAAGKPPAGTLLLEARGGSSLLVIEVRDDGRGLDYEAIRRRGIERGLLAAHSSASREELAQLIFQPGFSTRDGVSQVAGRGVGMDVVATTLDRLRGWVEVESNPGRGTCVRLLVPLRSAIEHVMVFRSGGQLFGVPLQVVHRAGARDGEPGKPCPGGIAQRAASPVPLWQLLELQPQEQGPSPHTLVIELSRRASGVESDGQGRAPACRGADPHRRFAIGVEAIAGPQEVVLRPLPPLLRHHRCFSGVTLAGSGEIVLLLDCQRLAELFGRQPGKPGAAVVPPGVRDVPPVLPPTLLVVDDSLSARRALTQALDRRGFQVAEAADGVEAMECLRNQRFAAVLSDVEMPRQDGFELLQGINADPRTRRVPVVIVSSRDQEVYRQRARDLGAWAYLTKPVSAQALDETLAKLQLASRVEG